LLQRRGCVWGLVCTDWGKWGYCPPRCRRDTQLSLRLLPSPSNAQSPSGSSLRASTSRPCSWPAPSHGPGRWSRACLCSPREDPLAYRCEEGVCVLACWSLHDRSHSAAPAVAGSNSPCPSSVVVHDGCETVGSMVAWGDVTSGLRKGCFMLCWAGVRRLGAPRVLRAVHGRQEEA
jgi:hypothetical protein